LDITLIDGKYLIMQFSNLLSANQWIRFYQNHRPPSWADRNCSYGHRPTASICATFC